MGAPKVRVPGRKNIFHVPAWNVIGAIFHDTRKNSDPMGTKQWIFFKAKDEHDK